MGNELFLIADGAFALFDPLGGDAGVRACSIAREAFRRDVAEVDRAIARAGAAVHEAIAADPALRGAACTLAALRVTPSLATIAWVGDVEVVRLRGQTMTALTQAHTLVNDWVGRGMASDPRTLAQLPSNVIVRALGMNTTVEVDTAVAEIEAGDLFVLLSDSVRAALGDELLASILIEHRGALRRCVCALLDAAGASGARDWLTVLGVLVSGNGEEGATAAEGRAVVTA